MKKIKAIFPVLSLVLVLFAGSCSSEDDIITETPQPEANFSVEMVPDNPQLVSFMNSSIDAKEYLWDFGDESEASTQKHPTHLYNGPGNYVVTLTAMNGEKSAEMSQEVTVYGIPTADFSYEADDDNSLTIHFENLSQNVDSFSWDFGDGTGTSNEQDPTYTYSETGTYSVKLTASGDGGSAETIVQVEVTDPMPDYDKLYIVGDASPSGWDISTPEAFTQSEDDPFVFTYEADFTPGNFKISTFTGDWCDGEWINAAQASAPLTSTDYIITQGCDGPDNQWVVTEDTAGRYLITVDLDAETINIEEVAVTSYSNLYIVGDATESGWDISNPKAFTQSETDASIFIYEANLNPGNFKISTFTGDWCDGEWLNSSNADQAIPETSEFIITQGCDGPDNQWVVTEETQGRYTITVNITEETVSFEEITPEFSELYAIGDASPNGWMPQDPSEAFVQSTDDPFVFTYEAYLSPGELKISTFIGEWCDGKWLNASEASQSLADAEYIVTTGCDGPDNKWIVTPENEGDYLIIVDLYNQTIVFEAQ